MVTLNFPHGFVSHAVVYIDKDRRVRVFDNGQLGRERYEPQLGWCMCADDMEPWPDECDALTKAAMLILDAVKN